MSKELTVKEISGDSAIPLGTRAVPIAHQFLDQDGDPVDLSVGVWSGEVTAEQLYAASVPTGLGSGNVVIDIPTATATYNWADEDFLTEGKFRLIIWIGNGTSRFGSTVYEWDVADAPGGTPTV